MLSVVILITETTFITTKGLSLMVGMEDSSTVSTNNNVVHCISSVWSLISKAINILHLVQYLPTPRYNLSSNLIEVRFFLSHSCSHIFSLIQFTSKKYRTTPNINHTFLLYEFVSPQKKASHREGVLREISTITETP